MNLPIQSNLKLTGRNEGKIKSYESCSDIRAWSHNVRDQNTHLREWMKSDMPISVIPASTLAGLLRKMTCKSRRRATPRCHPDCKSRVLLESISTSCQAIKQCLKQDDDFDRYFFEEELETSTWPCERCLEALKSIKMFWKIIMDKIFKINGSKYEEFQSYSPPCQPNDSVRSVAKVWEAEMVQQALFVKNVSPSIHRAGTLLFRPVTQGNETEFKHTPKNNFNSEELNSEISLTYPKNYRVKFINSKERERDLKDSNRRQSKLSRSISVQFKLKTVDVGCNTSFRETFENEIQVYERTLGDLKDKCNQQNDEIDKLINENCSLKNELQNFHKGCLRKTSFLNVDNSKDRMHSVNFAPEPFEGIAEEDDVTKTIDSEMIITMKNCKNECFKHVSLLQVLHKTNTPLKENLNLTPTGCRQDPIKILTKVQNTVGAIVQREMGIINDKKYKNKSDIKASFNVINGSSKSELTSSTLSSRASSEGGFMTTNDVSDKSDIKIQNIYQKV